METEKIPELEKRDYFKYRNDPLLEYAVEIADELWPSFNPEDCLYDEEDNIIQDGFDVSERPNRFGCRYTSGTIDTSRENIYLEHEDVQNTLKAFGLDKYKFWYLCLMLKDIMTAETVNAWQRPKDPCDELKELLQLLQKVSPENKGELLLNVGKETATVSGRQTMNYITDAIEKALEKAEKEVHVKTGPYNFNSIHIKDEKGMMLDRVTLPLMYQIATFHKLLMHFLKDKKPRKDIYASKDKMMLVSRMIYILGISDDERYNQEWTETGDKLNFLKNNIRRYQNVKLPTIQEIYAI